MLAYIGPGEPLNLVPALDDGPNLATVDAETEATLYLIPCYPFRQLMHHHPDLAQAALKRL